MRREQDMLGARVWGGWRVRWRVGGDGEIGEVSGGGGYPARPDAAGGFGVL